MLQRLIGLVVTAVGVVFALIIGFGALLLVGLTAAVAFCVYAVRTRRWRRGAPRRTDVIEGEFEVVDGNADPRSSGADAPHRVRNDEQNHG